MTAMLPVAFQLPVRLPRYHPNDVDLLARSWFVIVPAKTAMPPPGDLPAAQRYRQHFHPPDRLAPVCLSFRLYNERATTGLSEVKTSSYASSRKKDHPWSVVHHSILFGVSTIQRALSQASQPTLPVNPSIAEYPQLSSSVTKITFAISGSCRCSMHHCLNASPSSKENSSRCFFHQLRRTLTTLISHA